MSSCWHFALILSAAAISVSCSSDAVDKTLYYRETGTNSAGTIEEEARGSFYIAQEILPVWSFEGEENMALRSHFRAFLRGRASHFRIAHLLLLPADAYINRV